MIEEYEDEELFEDDDYDPLDERLAALEGQVAEQAEIADINRVIAAIEDERGRPFSQAEVQELGSLIDDGWDPSDAYTALELDRDADFDQQFAEVVERIERKEGRTLLEAELDSLWQAAEDEDDEAWEKSLLNFDKPSDRATYFEQRLREEPEQPEEVEPLAEDSSHKERVEYMEARIAGAEVAETTDEGDE